MMWWCLHLGREHPLQVFPNVSAFWSASYTESKNQSSTFGGLSLPSAYMRCYLLTIRYGIVGTPLSWLLYIHNSQNPKLQLVGWGCCLCLLISKWHWLQKPMSQLMMWWCLHLGRKHPLQVFPNVSAFWSASYTESKNLSSNFGGCLWLVLIWDVTCSP